MLGKIIRKSHGTFHELDLLLSVILHTLQQLQKVVICERLVGILIEQTLDVLRGDGIRHSLEPLPAHLGILVQDTIVRLPFVDADHTVIKPSDVRQSTRETEASKGVVDYTFRG